MITVRPAPPDDATTLALAFHRGIGAGETGTHDSALARDAFRGQL